MNRPFRWLSLLAALAMFASSCKDRSQQAPLDAAYGQPPATPIESIAKARPDKSPEQPWLNGEFSVLQTELSPAILFHARTKSLAFFGDLAASGLGGPTYAAMPTETGPKIFRTGTVIDPARLNESWMLVWFAGASGWTNWDSPWLVTLQRKPTSIEFSSNGLAFTFPREAGYAAMMPLYGYYKPPQKGREFLAAHGLPEKKKIRPAEWENGLHKDPLSRARYWASALKEFPVYCEDQFSVDRGTDTVTIRHSFRWVSWDDDWNTRHLKLAPVSPVLGHAFREGYAARFSKKPYDMEIFTSAGPLYGIEGVDSYDVTLPGLRYINETEVAGLPATQVHPAVSSAHAKLQSTIATVIRSGLDAPGELVRGAAEESQDVAEKQWYARALPYLDAESGAALKAVLKKLILDTVLVTNRLTRAHDAAAADAARAGMIETLWAYAHFTEDWELIRERWPLVKELFTRAATMRWAGFGSAGVVALGDQAASCLAMARLAYRAGDMDAYNYACHLFARELVQHWVKERGAKFFREHQPWHSMEPFDAEVYLTTLQRDSSGWHIDGPNYPRDAGERLFHLRWVRFNSPEVGRFYRDGFPADLRRQLDLLQSRWPAERKWRNEPGGLTGLVQLRSLLLRESPAQLAGIAMPDQFTGSPAGIVASCISLLRTSQPARYQRLIPGGAPSPFVTGLERDVAGPGTELIRNAVVEPRNDERPAWPRPSWPEWKSPAGGAWNFGVVQPSTNAPARMESIPLNWNTRALLYAE